MALQLVSKYGEGNTKKRYVVPSDKSGNIDEIVVEYRSVRPLIEFISQDKAKKERKPLFPGKVWLRDNGYRQSFSGLVWASDTTVVSVSLNLRVIGHAEHYPEREPEEALLQDKSLWDDEKRIMVVLSFNNLGGWTLYESSKETSKETGEVPIKLDSVRFCFAQEVEVMANARVRIYTPSSAALIAKKAKKPAHELDDEVLSALVALGYSSTEAKAAVQTIPDGVGNTLDERIKLALQYFN